MPERGRAIRVSDAAHLRARRRPAHEKAPRGAAGGAEGGSAFGRMQGRMLSRRCAAAAPATRHAGHAGTAGHDGVTLACRDSSAPCGGRPGPWRRA